MITGLLVIERHALLRLALHLCNILQRRVAPRGTLKATLRALMIMRLIMRLREASLKALNLQRSPHRDLKPRGLADLEEERHLRSLILVRASPPFRTSPLKALKDKRSSS